jgi:hypothetical protein
MVRTRSLYQLARVAWGAVAFAAVVVVYSGNARPYVPPDVLPYGAAGAFGVAVVLVLAGVFVVGRFEVRSWRRMGRAAGLEPDGWSVLSKPDLAGTVDGRSVRVSTYAVDEGGGGDDGGGSATYTLVEADLGTPVDDGYVLGRDAAGPVVADAPVDVGQRDLDGGHHVVGADAVSERVLTDDVRDTFDASPGAVVVGDPTDAFAAALPDDGDGFVGSMLSAGVEQALAERPSFDAATAATDDRGVLLDAAELDARIEAVVAVADAHETVDAEAPAA